MKETRRNCRSNASDKDIKSKWVQEKEILVWGFCYFAMLGSVAGLKDPDVSEATSAFFFKRSGLLDLIILAMET